MSVKLMSAIFETEFRDLQDEEGNTTKASTAKLVLLALADHANDDGEGAYPGLTKMELKTALSRQTIINTYGALKYNGIIYLAGISKRNTNNYTINTRAFPKTNIDGQATLLVKPLDSTSQAALPELVKPLDPNHPLTIQEPSKEVVSELPKTDETKGDYITQADQKVNFILENEKRITERNSWEGRAFFRPDHLPLVDWYHDRTGQTCPKSKQKDWMRALLDWTANNLTVADLKAAYEIDITWRGVFTSPNQLTEKAIAIKAQKKTKITQELPTVRAEDDDDSKYVPNPFRK